MPKAIDEKIVRFIDGLPRHLKYSEVAASIRRRFGSSRVWTVDRIRAHCLAVQRSFPLSKCEADAEVRAFIDDRIGRMTFDRLRSECVQQLGPDRAPSRSSLHRYYKHLRDQC